MTDKPTGVMAYVAFGLISMAEAADMLGIHRFTVHKRCKALGIDHQAARARYLRRLALRAQGTGWRPPTKAEHQARADRAKAAWDAR